MHEFPVRAPRWRKVAGKIGDGEGPKAGPDPRSQWQPHGFHGASRVYDQSVFVWRDQGWQAPPIELAVIYELHVGTFTPKGTFAAAIERLDYLAWVGITHLELIPVGGFPGG